jgi:hypothetical protein
MVPRIRFERTTFPLGGGRSILLSYRGEWFIRPCALIPRSGRACCSEREAILAPAESFLPVAFEPEKWLLWRLPQRNLIVYRPFVGYRVLGAGRRLRPAGADGVKVRQLSPAA